jgi:NAD(P)-dependent dehydrogenase (short-subunit alcohol dehydrogenase family)
MSRRDFISTTHATSYDYIDPTKLDLTGRNVIITGAAWDDGVGHATAIAFARAGASSIALIDLRDISRSSIDNVEAAALAAGRKKPSVVSFAVDISDLAAVEKMSTSLLESFGGRVDILVNNAAHQEPYGTILDSDPVTDWRTWEVNIHGLMNMTRSFLPTLLESHQRHDGLAININVASSGALSVRAGSSNYRSSKLAILRWTEILQLDHQEKGLLALCVNPGAIRTMMTINEPEKLRAMLPHKPDIAGDTIVWLAAERREWLAGRYVSCPWDMEELCNRKNEIVEGDKLKVKMVF